MDSNHYLPSAMSDMELAPLVLSLRISTLAMLVAFLPAMAVAWVLARSHRRWMWMLEAASMAPLVLPPLVTGYLLLLALGRTAPLGSWLYHTFGLEIAFTESAAVIAAAVMAFPLMVRAMQLGFLAVDRRLEGMSRTLGAGGWDSTWSITLPLALPGLLTAAILGFARALGEFGATIILAGNMPGQTQTAPLAIFTALNTPGGDHRALTLSAAMVFIGMGALAIAHLFGQSVQRDEKRRQT